MTNIAGKTDAARRPLCIPLSPELVPTPTREGPNVPPASPARASNAKSAVPPCGIRTDVRLMEPGHIMPTARPLTIHPAKAIIAEEDNAAVRYAPKHKIPAQVIYAERSILSPFFPYHNRPNPIQKAKLQGPARSPIDLSTPKEASAKADVHCAIELSDAPAAIISSRNNQKTLFFSNALILIPSAS